MNRPGIYARRGTPTPAQVALFTRAPADFALFGILLLFLFPTFPRIPPSWRPPPPPEMIIIIYFNTRSPIWVTRTGPPLSHSRPYFSLRVDTFRPRNHLVHGSTRNSAYSGAGLIIFPVSAVLFFFFYDWLNFTTRHFINIFEQIWKDDFYERTSSRILVTKVNNLSLPPFTSVARINGRIRVNTIQ